MNAESSEKMGLGNTSLLQVKVNQFALFARKQLCYEGIHHQAPLPVNIKANLSVKASMIG